MKRLIYLICLISLLCGLASAQTYSDTALTNSQGNYARAIPYAVITLCASTDTPPCAHPVTTYQSQALGPACTLVSGGPGVGNGGPTSGTNCNNPGLADAQGNFTFFAPVGLYKVCIYNVNWICQLKVVPSSSGSGSGGGNPILENCTPDQTGNSFYNVLSLSNFFYAAWNFVFNTSTSINCTVFIPTAQTGATFVLDIAANDATAGHTANFQTCDGLINSGSINIGALTCATAQTFTTTSTAYNRVTLTFNVQTTLQNNSVLVVKIATAPTGTAPTSNLLVYPHFVL